MLGGGFDLSTIPRSPRGSALSLPIVKGAVVGKVFVAALLAYRLRRLVGYVERTVAVDRGGDVDHTRAHKEGRAAFAQRIQTLIVEQSI